MTSRETARRFHFIRQVATGGFGTVYLCKVMHADGFSRIVAVKLLNAQWSDNQDVTSRIRDEARLLGLLRHRHIVDVIDLTSIDGRTAVVMEYLEAVDLRFLTAALREAERQMPVRVALELMAQAAHALDAAYNRPPMPGDKPLRVIHRDIKPSNIMLDAHGVSKVLDFGVAQSEIESREANTQELQFGSVEYMAPERLFFEPETPASDVYSLGASLYEILAQERLGKARGRPDRHAAHLADRLSFLRSRISAKGTVATELELLLRESLDFEHEKRPTAAGFHQRAKALARLTDDEDLASWAEIELPPIIEAAQSRPQEASPISNSVLTEDSQAFRSWDEGGVSALDAALDDVGAMRAREEERAEALRKGALAELEASGDVQVQPATGAPAADGRGGGGPDVHEPTDGVGWNDATAGHIPVHEAQPPPLVLPGETTLPAGLDLAGVDVPEAPRELTPTGRLSAPHSDDDVGLKTDEVLCRDFEEDATAPKLEATTLPKIEQVRPDLTTMDGLEPPRRRSPALFLVMGGLLPLVLALSAGVVLVVLDVGGIRGRIGGVLGREAPAQVEEKRASRGNEAVTEAMAEGGGIRFESRWAGTTKLKVRCGEASGRGGTSAMVAADKAARCDVTAIQADMSRKVAVVRDATIGTYLCFVGGLTECTRK